MGLPTSVVDFEFLAVKVARPETQFSLHEEGVRPAEPVFPHRSGIAAEEGHYFRLVGIDDEEPA